MLQQTTTRRTSGVRGTLRSKWPFFTCLAVCSRTTFAIVLVLVISASVLYVIAWSIALQAIYSFITALAAGLLARAK